MSAFEHRTDTAVANAYDEADRYQSILDRTTERLAGDDEILVEGLSDALYDRRTRDQIIAAFKSGDLLEAARVMHDHATTTYVTESAEVIAEKECYQ